MAWLSTAPAEWTIDSVEYICAEVPFKLLDGTTMYQWKLTSTRKHKGCMTKAAADAEAAAYKEEFPYHEVNVNRQNDAGAYRVDVVGREGSTWEPEE